MSHTIRHSNNHDSISAKNLDIGIDWNLRHRFVLNNNSKYFLKAMYEICALFQINAALE